MIDMTFPSWALNNTRRATGLGVTVAVIDSGWDRSISDSRIVSGVGLVDDEVECLAVPSNDDSDRNGHGTVCTQLLLEGAPGVCVIPVRVFGKRLETSAEVIERAIDWSARAGARVINLSLGTQRVDAKYGLYAACQRACDSGTIIVAACAVPRGTYPAAFEPVLSVAGCRMTHPLEFIYQAGEIVECLARADALVPDRSTGIPVQKVRASFAAPRITAVVSLMLERWPSMSLGDLRLKLAEYGTVV
jgi:subtilisin family serine protease